jgi:hypothetical protein
MDAKESKRLADLKEKRKHVRVEIMGEVKFEAVHDSKMQDAGLKYDIGIGGVSILIERELKHGTALRLELDLEDGMGPFVAMGSVVWQDKFGAGKSQLMGAWNRTGIIFTDMDKDKIQRVFRFLYNHVNKSKV